MAEQMRRWADDQHGKDGLSNLTETHPHFTPAPAVTDSHDHLDLDDRPSWEVMLEMLEKEEEGSVTIVALGPCTLSFNHHNDIAY